MGAIWRFAKGFVRFFDLHRAEGWRLIGYLTVYATIADALNMGNRTDFVGAAGLVVVNAAQKAIEEREPKPRSTVTINMTSSAQAATVAAALREQLGDLS